EGEKQFDLVLRFEKNHRSSDQALENTTVRTSQNTVIPLSELAQIDYSSGPAKISRDNTKRRIVVGVNVRNRDLESVVEDVSSVIRQNIKLPPGYSIDYGGQFENLRVAKKQIACCSSHSTFLDFYFIIFCF
ncbi:MAG TPA: hypothetical protein DCR42_05180, partial [Flavobacteriaceae bacterium]|nr:hypothetical protein [Flavobacteriaceae bacterium]